VITSKVADFSHLSTYTVLYFFLSVSDQLSSLFEIRHFNRRKNVASRLNLGSFEQL
jgi:hypothetical protein